MEDKLSVLRPFILSWNLRNLLPDTSNIESNTSGIVGTCAGEYPISGWKPYYIETPREDHKRDLTGRFNTASDIRLLNTEWIQRRIINFPVYSIDQDFDIDMLKIIIRNWGDIGIPDDIPCVALAVKCSGFYSDFREAQYVTVLLIWSDGVARIASLDWFEGPLDDCTTPEWYMKSTPMMNLNKAIDEMRNVHKNLNWDSPSYSVYSIPQCLMRDNNGDRSTTSHDQWNMKWSYTKYSDLQADLDPILSQVHSIFFEEEEVVMYG